MEINYELGNFLFEKKMGDFGAPRKTSSSPLVFLPYQTSNFLQSRASILVIDRFS